MAENTAIRNNALPYPIYGLPWVLDVIILDNDGDPVDSAAGLDSEISKNGDTAADCTNEATFVANGHYTLALTGSELTADMVSGITKTSTTDAKNTLWTLYPKKLPTVRSGTAAGGASGSITLDSGALAIDGAYAGCLIAATIDGTLEVRICTGYVGSTKVASVTPNWNTTPDSDDPFVIYLPDGVQTQQANVLAISGDAAAAAAQKSYLDGSEFMPVDAHKQNFAVSGGQLTTKKPDGTTDTDYSPKSVTTDPTAEPITGAS